MGQRIHLGELAGLAPQSPTFDDFDHMFRSDGQEQVRASAEVSSELVLLDTQTPEGFSMYRAPDGTVLVDVPAEYIPAEDTNNQAHIEEDAQMPRHDSADDVQHTGMLQLAWHRTGKVDVSASGHPEEVFAHMQNLSRGFSSFGRPQTRPTLRDNPQAAMNVEYGQREPEVVQVPPAEIQGLPASDLLDEMLGADATSFVDEQPVQGEVPSPKTQARVRKLLVAPATKRLLKTAIFAGVAIPVYHKGYDVGHDMISHLPVVSLLKGFFN